LVNNAVRADRAMTMIPAPPRPMTTRDAMNSATDVEYAQAADPAPNIANERSRTFLWP
jgi:hypothetical protein